MVNKCYYDLNNLYKSTTLKKYNTPIVNDAGKINSNI